MTEVAEQVGLRDAGAADVPFLFSLYCDVRGPEVAAWGWNAEQSAIFLRMQFEAQRRWYEGAFPEAAHHIVTWDGVPIGRRMTAPTAEGMHLVDIALLGAYRNRGIGSWLIGQLAAECDAAGKVLGLQVLWGNPAIRLYQRLGFIGSGVEEMYIRMERPPEGAWPTENPALAPTQQP
jgi:GNAT superfamily N-acetyltransferase